MTDILIIIFVCVALILTYAIGYWTGARDELRRHDRW